MATTYRAGKASAWGQTDHHWWQVGTARREKVGASSAATHC